MGGIERISYHCLDSESDGWEREGIIPQPLTCCRECWLHHFHLHSHCLRRHHCNVCSWEAHHHPSPWKHLPLEILSLLWYVTLMWHFSEIALHGSFSIWSSDLISKQRIRKEYVVPTMIHTKISQSNNWIILQAIVTLLVQKCNNSGHTATQSHKLFTDEHCAAS